MSPFHLPFIRDSLAASLLAANALAFLGVFVLLRRVAFSGLAVSQMAALGAVVGGILGHNVGGFGTALVFVGLGILLLGALSASRRVPAEAWVACLYVLGAASAVLILSKHPLASGEDAVSVFFGNILSLGPTEILEGGALLAAVLCALLPFFHRWVWIFFDPLSAGVAGIRARRWNAAFLALFSAAMTVGIHLFGVLLAFAYLILPGAAGLLLARRMTPLFLFLPVMTSGCIVLGVYLSFRWDYPTGPFIAGVMGLAVLAAGLFRALADKKAA